MRRWVEDGGGRIDKTSGHGTGGLVHFRFESTAAKSAFLTRFDNGRRWEPESSHEDPPPPPFLL